MRYKGYSFINIAGLAIGIASSLAVLLWVFEEVSYDNFHEQGESIYRCHRTVERPDGNRVDEMMSAPIGPAIKDRTPAVLDQVRLLYEYQKLGYQDKSYVTEGLFVDPSFLDIFTFDLIKGDPNTALASPSSVILTEEAALRLFGDQDPMGKILSNGLAVTGIARNVPNNSSIDFDFLAPLAHAEQAGLYKPDSWYSFAFETYFLLRDMADPATVHPTFADLTEIGEDDANIALGLQPLGDVHLRGLDGGGRIVYVYVFSCVAVLLLAVACVNFMNLATARAEKRLMEIGLRKAIGASRFQLAVQVIGESLIQTFIALLLAICLLEAAMPWIENLYGRPLDLQLTGNLVLGLLGITLLTGLAAGGYPALVLSSFRPASVLKRTSTSGSNRTARVIRKGLVVFQFTISTVLIFGALAIYSQLEMIKNKDLGLHKDNVITVRASGLSQDYTTVKHMLMQNPGVQGVTATFQPPNTCGWYSVGYDYDGRVEGQDLRIGVAWVDHDYVDVFGLEMLQGRNFSTQFASDETEGYLINQAAARNMGFDNPIGKTIDVGSHPGRVVGVVKDFHYSSLHDDIGPLAMSINPTYYYTLCIRLSGEDIAAGLGFVERTFNELRPGEEFQFSFFDALLGRAYRAEMQMGKIILTFTIITVLVACLGLFGLAAHSAERRKKEIGIRKVLGSSTAGIVGLLTREFVTLVVLGNIIAAPLSYYATSLWLQSFSYRIDLGWERFLIPLALAVVTAIVTVCYQAIRAATANPVDSLQYE